MDQGIHASAGQSCADGEGAHKACKVSGKHDHPLKGPPEWSPTSINLKIEPTGPNLVQGTYINLLGSTSPPPRCNKWFSPHPPQLISGKIIQEWWNYHFFLGSGDPK
jgi:hypothetical protein